MPASARETLTALEAYAYAARVAEVENPKCHLAWTTLAGIGMVESHHGTYRGATIAPNGDVTPPIRGVRLDGGDALVGVLGPVLHGIEGQLQRDVGLLVLAGAEFDGAALAHELQGERLKKMVALLPPLG